MSVEIYSVSSSAFVAFDIRDLKQDDDDSSENDGKKNKFGMRSFKLNRVSLDPVNMSNAGDFFWS